EVDPAPADVECPLPAGPVVVHHRAAPADAGVVEQQVDHAGVVLFGDLVAEALQLALVGDVGVVGGDADALGHAVGLGQPNGLGHVPVGDVAHGDVAALG